jgi:hypothetical protein
MSKEARVQGIPPGLITLESTAHHLHVSARRLQALTAQTSLRRVAPVSLGRSLGTYRLIPQLGIAVLRQVNAGTSYHLQAWQAALADLLASDTWLEATAQLSRRRPVRGDARGGSAAVERILLSSALCPLMEALHRESMAALDRHGLAEHMQVEAMIVDRLEDDDDAVILVGAEQRAYLLPRVLLRVARLDREKAWGVLLATQTSAGIEVDVWPAAGEGEGTEWYPDLALLVQRVDVSA